jgi:Family of unknown function (DUF5681)
MRNKKASRKSASGYHVGKGRPPVATRWKPGQSGNPRGRPRGSKNLGTMLTEELNEKVKIQRNGGTQSVTKRQVIVKRLVNNAVNGDWKATNLVLDHDREPSPDFSAPKKTFEERVNIENLTHEERQKRAADTYFKLILEPRQKPMPR